MRLPLAGRKHRVIAATLLRYRLRVTDSWSFPYTCKVKTRSSDIWPVHGCTTTLLLAAHAGLRETAHQKKFSVLSGCPPGMMIERTSHCIQDADPVMLMQQWLLSISWPTTNYTASRKYIPDTADTGPDFCLTNRLLLTDRSGVTLIEQVQVTRFNFKGSANCDYLSRHCFKKQNLA